MSAGNKSIAFSTASMPSSHGDDRCAHDARNETTADGHSVNAVETVSGQQAAVKTLTNIPLHPFLYKESWRFQCSI